jgi:hypothetical protein
MLPITAVVREFGCAWRVLGGAVTLNFMLLARAAYRVLEYIALQVSVVLHRILYCNTSKR